MQRAAVSMALMLVAGCQDRPVRSATPVAISTPGVAPAAPGPALAPAAPAVAPAPPPAPAVFSRVEAPPGGTIVRLAVTPMDDAALTIDDADQIRLWPALDGSRRPVAVDLPAAQAIALQRVGDQFAVFAVFATGSIVATIDGDGHIRSHVELGPFDRVATAGTGFIATRAGVHTSFTTDGGSGGQGTPPKPRKPAVTAQGSDLVIRTAAGPRYLGYAFPGSELWPGGDAAHVIVPGSGTVPSYDHATRLAAGARVRVLLLDAQLAPARELAPWTPVREPATGMTWLGDDDWLVASASGLSLWTAGAPAGTLVLPNARAVERSADLVLIDGRQLRRYVAARHALEPVAFTDWGQPETESHLVTPALAHGAVMIQTTWARDDAGGEHFAMRWIHDLAHPDRGAIALPLDGYFAAAHDNAGRVLVGERNSRVGATGKLLVYGDGVELDPHTLASSPDATRALSYEDDGTARLTDLAGHERWVQKIPLDPIWLDADHLIATRRHGVAAISPATGAVLAIHTGWGFELGAAPHPVSELGRPLALERAALRDPPIAFAGDTAFQQLARAVAAGCGCELLWWGPVQLDGAPTRVALLQLGSAPGSPVLGYLVEAGDAAHRGAFVIAVQSMAFSDFQNPITGEPAWGIERQPDGDGDGGRPVHTIDRRALRVSTRWIHGSYEHLDIAVRHGKVVVAHDEWLDRDNNGHGYDVTQDRKDFSDPAPELVGFKGAGMMQGTVSAVSTDPSVLAAAIHPRTP